MVSPAIIPHNIFYSNYPSIASVAFLGFMEERHLEYISEVVAYIHKNYSKDISLEEITQRAYLSKFHFSRIFKKYTSYSPYQYLIAVRLSHSKQLLLNSEYPIKEVADKCGFKRLDYFSSMFKKKFKCNPSQYREARSAAVEEARTTPAFHVA